MSENLIIHKCPNCSGQLKFDIASQKFLCDHCGGAYLDEELRSEKAEDIKQEEEFVERTLMFMCPSCSAMIMADSRYAVTARCHYCDSDIVIGTRVGSDCKPDYVLPFRITHEQAKEKILDFLKSKKYIPSHLCSEEALTNFYGVYIPTWLGHSDVVAEYDAEWVDGELAYDSKYNCYRVLPDAKYLHVRRKATFCFEGIPAGAVRKLNNDFMESVEPYDYSELKEFDMMYLSGYAAEKYSVPFREVSDYIELRARREARDRIIGSERYMLSKVYRQETEVENIEAKYGMLPLYMCNIEHGGEKHTIIVNGQTGKVNGTVPVDSRKLLLRNLLVCAGVLLLAIIAWLVFVLPLHTGGEDGNTGVLKYYALLAMGIGSAYYLLLHKHRERVYKSHTQFNLSRLAAEYSIRGTEKYEYDEKIFNGRYNGERSIPKDELVYNTDR